MAMLVSSGSRTSHAPVASLSATRAGDLTPSVWPGVGVAGEAISTCSADVLFRTGSSPSISIGASITTVEGV